MYVLGRILNHMLFFNVNIMQSHIEILVMGHLETTESETQTSTPVSSLTLPPSGKPQPTDWVTSVFSVFSLFFVLKNKASGLLWEPDFITPGLALMQGPPTCIPTAPSTSHPHPLLPSGMAIRHVCLEGRRGCCSSMGTPPSSQS